MVGIPSYNEADNIAFVAKQCDEGLRQYFPDQKGIIVNVDNDSTDDTRGAFLGMETETPKFSISTPEGVKGKGNNYTLDLDHEESEVEIRLQAREFRRLRRYLKKRYNGAP